MTKRKVSLKSVRNFLEKHQDFHKKASPILGAFEATFRKLGVKVPSIPKIDLFKLLESYDRLSVPLYIPDGYPNILFFTPRFWPLHSIVENIIASALSLRGTKISFATCEGRLPICNIRNVHQGFQMPCDYCISLTNKIFQHSCFPKYSVCRYLDNTAIIQAVKLTEEMTFDQLEHFKYDNLPLGELIKISVRWFLAGNVIHSLQHGLKAYRRFLAGSIIIFEFIKKLLDEVRPDVIFMLNGLLFEERIMYAIAQRNSIPIVTYECGFIKNTFIFARNKIACYYDLSEHWQNFNKKSLTNEENKWLDDYLEDRQIGNRCTIQYWPTREERITEIRKQLNLELNKNIAVLFTNIVWDSAVQEKEIGFDGLFDWVKKTILYFNQHREYHLILRIHPAEVRLKGRETQERVNDHIKKSFPKLPGNITIVKSESDISSYRLIEMSDVVLVYTSTIGLEASLMGKPVIVSAKTHYRRKGFTIEAENLDEYYALLDKFLQPGNFNFKPNIKVARRYANMFFRRHMIDFSSIINQNTNSKISLLFDSMVELKSSDLLEIENVSQFIIESADNSKKWSLII